MKELRDLLPEIQKIHYMNYAATGPVLLPSVTQWKRLVEETKEPLQFHRNTWLAHLEKARRLVAELIHASTEEIAFVSNTGSGLSLIANAIRWKEGDRVLYPSDEFPSNRYVWENLVEKGVKPEAINVDQIGSFDLTRVRLISLSAVSYWDGRRHNIKEIARLCRSRGILIAVDAIQAVGAVPVDVKEWDCDFLASGGQKWLFGPVGTGFVYIKKERIPELFVPQVGWASSRTPRDFEGTKLAFTDGARRFEPGLSDIPALAALSTSIETMGQIGWDRIHGRIAQLIQTARRQFLELGIEPITPEGASGILAVPMQMDIQAKLLEKKVIAMQRSGRLRISLHASANEEDLAALFEVVSGSAKKITLAPIQKPNRSVLGKNALVTGASTGLGRAVAIELAKRGYSVLLVARQVEKLEELAAFLRKTYGVPAEPFPLDLSDPGAVSRAEFEVDFLANCAADADAELFSSLDFDPMRKSFEVNFFSPLILAQKVVQSGKGTILNIVTAGARCALPLFSSYSAAKGALWAWSESFSRETKGTAVSVTTFLPPHMDSDTSLKIGRKALSYYSIGKSEPLKDAASVAKQAVDAALSGILFAAPFKARMKIVLNALFPTVFTRVILRRWKR